MTDPRGDAEGKRMNENSGKPEQEQGLYRKYHVERLNDKAGKHANCIYYVLDLDHDKHSVAALMASNSYTTKREER